MQIGIVLYPRFTQLDAMGPFEVFSRIPGGTVHLVAHSTEPVRSDTGLRVLPTVAFEDCPPLDVVCVPGGPGDADHFDDDVLLGFLRNQAKHARYVTSVCTGALLLGAAGLLQGYRATTYWAAHEALAAFGATPVKARVVHDRDRITGGGVTAGIDFAFSVVAELVGAPVAQLLQLGLEYDPEPPFDTGSPEKAGPELVAMVKANNARNLEARKAAVEAAAARLSASS